jgi:hypothetical protein
VWDDLVKKLSRYPTAVVTIMDADGYPFSIRCVPEPDSTRQVLRVALPDYMAAQAGPAGLLCHFHDDELWNQTNFIVRGTLEPDGHNWIFTPVRVIEGAGAGMSLTRQLRNGRRTARRYLKKRGLNPPTIPWARISAAYKKARAQ